MTPDATTLAADALRDLDAGPVRVDLPGGGRLFLDHPVPVLVVHRCPPEDATGRPVCSEAHALVTSQPAYLMAEGRAEAHAAATSLARGLVEGFAERFEAALAPTRSTTSR